jgi:hypothetical protein
MLKKVKDKKCPKSPKTIEFILFLSRESPTLEFGKVTLKYIDNYDK